MAKNQQTQEEELVNMLAEEEAKKLAVSAVASVQARVVASVPVFKTADVKVLCIKDEPWVKLGDRVYTFKKNVAIRMNHSHATEMQGAGYVVIQRDD